MNNVWTGVTSIWKRSWTFLGVILQRFGSERDIEPRSLGYRPRTLILYSDYRPGDRSITYTFIYLITFTPRNVTNQLQGISASAADTRAIPVTAK